MRVRAGIMTGLHLQSVDLFVQGSELYSNIGIFQSSASARTNDLQLVFQISAQMVVARVQLLRWALVDRCWF